MKINISKMCGLLEERFFEPVEPMGAECPEVSSERIRALAFAKLREQGAGSGAPNQKKEKHMKTSVKVLLVAAFVCAMSVTAFAALGGMDFFRAIFGESAGSVADQIQFPLASVENNDYRLSVESLLSDGFKTDVIVSLTAKNGQTIPSDPYELFPLSIIGREDAMKSASYTEMPEFSSKGKTYYHLELTSLENHASDELSVTLKEDLAPLSVTVPIDGAMTARKEITVGAGDYADQNYYPETVQLSPMGVLVIGSEKEAKGGLPTAQIFVQMKDGSREELISRSSFGDYDLTASLSGDGGGETVIGGGGAVLVGPGETAPLVIETMGQRNPDGKMVTSGTFSRILDLDEVQAIIVDDVEYPLR